MNIVMEKSEILWDHQNVTQTQAVSKHCWKNGAIDVLSTGLTQTSNLLNIQ